jgi:hypothetical protein
MTPAQYTTLKSLADADQTASALIAQGNDIGLADWMNAPTSQYIWRQYTPADDVFDAIVWANLTPIDAPDGTALWTNRALLCQAKQINLQIMLQGKERVATAKPNIRNSLSDALLNVPSGASGATQSAGWAAVKSVISRIGTRAEMALATGAGTQASPSTPAWEGMFTASEASAVRVS